MEGVGGSGSSRGVYHFQIVSTLLGSSNENQTPDDGGGGWYCLGHTEISIDDCSPPRPCGSIPSATTISSVSVSSPAYPINSESGLLAGTTFVSKLAQTIQSEFLRPSLLHMDHTYPTPSTDEIGGGGDVNTSTSLSSSSFPHITIGIIEANAQSYLPIEHCLSRSIQHPPATHCCVP